MSSPFELSDETPVYVISVAAELSGLHPQTLRAYDRLGLVSPGRSAGRGRRYSVRDIVLLREVQRLSQEAGVNLAGIKRILELEAELDQYRHIVAEAAAQMAQLRAELESTRAVAARLAGRLRHRGSGAELVPVRDAPDAAGPSQATPTARIRSSLRAAAGSPPDGARPAAPTGDPGPATPPSTKRVFESS
jgi:MerR family transcriptional regulator, heat shock protein HspR